MPEFNFHDDLVGGTARACADLHRASISLSAIADASV
jgi:hypothetical protein